QPAEVRGLGEQQREVAERRGPVEDERHVGGVVEVGVLLERRDEHPVEGEGQGHGEDADDDVGRGLLAPAGARHQATAPGSVRRANRSISTDTTTSSGNMNMAIAAPAPSELARMPVW